MSTDQDSQGSSTRPYLIRALHDWCTDNGFTPYLAVFVDRSVQVPQEYVKNNEIVLNVSFEATSQLQLGNDFVQFKARFGGVAREICVPTSISAGDDDKHDVEPGGTTGQVTALHAATENLPAGERGPGLRLARGNKPSEALKGGASDAAEPTVNQPPAGEGDEPPPDLPSPNNGRPALRRIK